MLRLESFASPLAVSGAGNDLLPRVSTITPWAYKPPAAAAQGFDNVVHKLSQVGAVLAFCTTLG